MTSGQSRKYVIWVLAAPLAVLATLALLLISCIALFGDDEDPEVYVTNNSSQPLHVLSSTQDDRALPQWPVVGSYVSPRQWGISYLHPGAADALLVQEPVPGVVGDIHIFVFINSDTNTVIDMQLFSFDELESTGMELAFDEPES